MTIPKFKRETTKFDGGDCPRNINDLLGRFDPEEPGEVAIIKCVNEDEDLWKVRRPNGEYFHAYGDDMTPRPDAPATNIEFVSHLMTWGQTAFTQAFIIEAAIRYADQVLADEDKTREQMANHLISPDLMISTAREVRDFLTARD